MNTFYRICTAITLAAALVTFSPRAHSLGLGDATVESFLNQPLQVKIDLLSRETDDLTSITAALASADDYELIGASRESVSVPIRFSVEDLEGDAHILATSELPVSAPVVRLIVEVNWSKGRLLREYTIFLDPPTFSGQAPLPRVDLRKSATVPIEQPVASEPPVEPDSAPPVERSVPVRQPSVDEYGPVRGGDTLWKIALDFSRGTGLEVNKVMIAIQRENPQAFINDNINLLRRGAILRMPAIENVENISMVSAISEVSAQRKAFEVRRSGDAMASVSTPLLAQESAALEAEEFDVTLEEAPAPEEAQEVVQEEASEVVSAAVEVEVEPADVLELVPPSPESELDSTFGFEEGEQGVDAIPDAAVALRENLARTEEELINQQQQNTYLEQRIQELESRLASAEQGSVADADLANMEDRLRNEREAAAAVDAAAKAQDEPWYTRLSVWLIVLLVLAAAFFGWLLSRRGGESDTVSDLGSDEGQLREIKDEAEEVLRVLEEPEEAEEAEEPAEAEAVTEEGQAAEPGAVEEDAQEQPAETSREAQEEDADVPEDEGSDPEIQMDLARAYISMGDKEAARVILEEVLAHGNDEQQTEARKMLDLMAS